MKKILFALAPLVLLAGCASASAEPTPGADPSPSPVTTEANYNDPDQLASSIIEEWNKGNPPDGVTATTVQCMKYVPATFACIIDLSNGQAGTSAFVVSADGKSWVAAPR